MLLERQAENVAACATGGEETSQKTLMAESSVDSAPASVEELDTAAADTERVDEDVEDEVEDDATETTVSETVYCHQRES